MQHLVAHLWTKFSFLFPLPLAFVFGTLLEFTVVIFLKYYLRHLPAFQLSRDSSKVNSRAVSMGKRDSVFDVKSHVNAWLKVCKFCSKFKYHEVPALWVHSRCANPHKYLGLWDWIEISFWMDGTQGMDGRGWTEGQTNMKVEMIIQM